MSRKNPNCLCDLTDTTAGTILRGRRSAPRIAEKPRAFNAILKDVEEGDWLRVLAYINETPFGGSGMFTEIEGDVQEVWKDDESIAGVVLMATHVINWQDDQRRCEQHAPTRDLETGSIVSVQLLFPPRERAKRRSDYEVNTDAGDGFLSPFGHVIRVEYDPYDHLRVQES